MTSYLSLVAQQHPAARDALLTLVGDYLGGTRQAWKKTFQQTLEKLEFNADPAISEWRAFYFWNLQFQFPLKAINWWRRYDWVVNDLRSFGECGELDRMLTLMRNYREINGPRLMFQDFGDGQIILTKLTFQECGRTLGRILFTTSRTSSSSAHTVPAEQ